MPEKYKSGSWKKKKKNKGNTNVEQLKMPHSNMKMKKYSFLKLHDAKWKTKISWCVEKCGCFAAKEVLELLNYMGRTNKYFH